MKNITALQSQRQADLVLKCMIAVNIVMFVSSLIFSHHEFDLHLNPMLILNPSIDALKFLGGTGRSVISQYDDWWSLVTANWLHGGLIHLLFNMLALRTLLPLVAGEYGISRMFSIYTLGGIFGFLLSYLGNVYLTIGASSGLCALIGAAFYFGKSRGGPWGQLVYRQTTGWVFTLALIGFILPNINNWSHAGGLVCGIFLGWIFSYNEKRQENIVDKGIAVSLAGLTGWLLVQPIIQAVAANYF